MRRTDNKKYTTGAITLNVPGMMPLPHVRWFWKLLTTRVRSLKVIWQRWTIHNPGYVFKCAGDDATATCEAILKVAHHQRAILKAIWQRWAKSEPKSKSFKIDLSIGIAVSGSGSTIWFKDPAPLNSTLFLGGFIHDKYGKVNFLFTVLSLKIPE